MGSRDSVHGSRRGPASIGQARLFVNAPIDERLDGPREIARSEPRMRSLYFASFQVPRSSVPKYGESMLSNRFWLKPPLLTLSSKSALFNKAQ